MKTDSNPLDTMILVGGKGTRLQSVVRDRPKPMAAVAGRPFIEWLVIALKAQGVRRVIFCSGYLSEEIESYFRGGKQWNMEIVYSRDPIPLGTGGAIRYALNHVCSDRFLVMNGDSYCRVDINLLKKNHISRGACASLWLVYVEDCRHYGSVEINKDGDVQAFKEKPIEKKAGLINAGVYLLEHEVAETIPEGRVVSIETDFFPRLIGQGLYAVVGAGPFFDIGTPETYTKAQYFFTSHAMT